MRLAAVLIAAASLTPASASADIIELKEGDVYCIAYDEDSNSCASVQTLKDLGDGNYVMLDLAGFAFGPTKLDMVASFEAFEEDGKLCIAPDGINVAITPKESKLSEGYQTLMQYTLTKIAEEGYCFEHKPCGEEWVAIGWVAGKARQDMSATFRVFSADDPRSQTVQPRYLGEDEMSTMQKKVSDQCFPKDA